MTDCLISLGGNDGDVSSTFAAALERLHQTRGIVVRAVSSQHRTQSVGIQAGAEFLNAAAVLESSLTPSELLNRLLAVELELGRHRKVHWGPRTLDLDLICFGDRVIDERPSLRVPHPASWYRRFVLDPVVEIAPQFVHPGKRSTFANLRDRLLVRPLPISVVGSSQDLDLVIRSIAADFPEASLRWIADPSKVPIVDEGLLIGFGVADESLRHRIGWLDATDIPGDPRQTIVDILRSAGLHSVVEKNESSLPFACSPCL